MIYDKMDDCFLTLKEKIDYSLKNTDLDSIFKTLDNIKGPTIVTGVGGSSIVATFLAKVLREKNHIIATYLTNRDLLYMDLGSYENIIAISASGNNIGVDCIRNNNLNKYLFTVNPQKDLINMVYTMKKEVSYVSISATFIPLSIILLYYQNNLNIIEEILDSDIDTDSNSSLYEVLTGYESLTAATLIESSMIEGGLASIVLHDKYNYCHGRINLTKLKSSDLIVYKGNSELEDLYEDHLYKYYNNIIEIPFKYEDKIINDYYLAYISLRLIYKIALNKKIDISNMKELVDNDFFYLFKGKL